MKRTPRVATPAGVRRFGLPINSPITGKRGRTAIGRLRAAKATLPPPLEPATPKLDKDQLDAEFKSLYATVKSTPMTVARSRIKDAFDKRSADLSPEEADRYRWHMRKRFAESGKFLDDKFFGYDAGMSRPAPPKYHPLTETATIDPAEKAKALDSLTAPLDAAYADTDSIHYRAELARLGTRRGTPQNARESRTESAATRIVRRFAEADHPGITVDDLKDAILAKMTHLGVENPYRSSATPGEVLPMMEEFPQTPTPHFPVRTPATMAADYDGAQQQVAANPEMLEALYDYAGEGYKKMNSYTRTSPDPETWSDASVARKIHALDSAMEISRAPKPITTFRLIGVDVNTDSLVPGTTYKDSGFVSTTADPQAYPELGAGAYYPQSSTMEIRVPAGTPTIFVPGSRRSDDPSTPGYGALDGEMELILGRGLTYRIVSHDQSKRHMIVEVVPE